MEIAQYSFSLFSEIMYFKDHKNIYRAFTSSFASFIYLTYFPPLSTSTFNSTITRWCRNNNVCGSEEQYSPAVAPEELLPKPDGWPSHPHNWEHAVQITEQACKMGKRSWWSIFSEFLLCGFFMFATHMSPPIVSENVSLSGKIRIQHIQHRITHRLMLFTCFILVIAEEELKWDHQAPSGSSSLCRLGKLYYSRGSGRAVHRQKLSGLSADRNTFFIFLLLPSSSSKSGWGNFSFEAKEPTRLAQGNMLSLQQKPKQGRTKCTIPAAFKKPAKPSP